MPTEPRLSGQEKMEKVPFEKIGVGQSARLVYQVIGENGPIFNPRRIRYLPPDAASDFLDQPLNLPGAFTSLAAVNLVASAGNTALSVSILREVKQLNEKVSSALFTLGRIESKIDRLIQHIERIDARVSEGNLRHAIDHILSKAVSNSEIDLTQLARISGDLEIFAQSINGGIIPCNALGLRLSSDVEDKLEAIYKLFFGIRYFICTQHNDLVKGDPFNTIHFDTKTDYFPETFAQPSIATGATKMINLLDEASMKLGQKVYNGFMWADENKAKEYSEWLTVEVILPVLRILDEAAPGTLSLVTIAADTDNIEQPSNYFEKLREYWLWRTSAGLLWRVYSEAKWLTMGYNHTLSLDRESTEQLEGTRLILSAPLAENELDELLKDYVYS